MYLTKEEERILSGALGEGPARALNVIVKVGEALGAERLVPIRHAHVSGVSYGNIGEAGVRLMEELAEAGARFTVPTTVNPIGFDAGDPGPYDVDEDYLRGQARILRALKSMGAQLTLTCTPYETSSFNLEAPPPGSHVAWGESSAVVYANSFLGLRTNREGGPLALMAAIAGRTYYYGLHTDEARVPRVEYRVGLERPLDEVEAALVGALIGEGHEGPEPPALRARLLDKLALRELAAALGTAGPHGMIYVHGETPEPLPKDWRPEEVVELEERELEERLAGMKPQDPGDVDVYFTGCPHMPYEDLERLAVLFRKYGRARRPFIVSIPPEAYVRALAEGIASTLYEHGVRMARGTCLIVSPFKVKGLRIATNSYKAMFYLARRGAKVYLAKLEDLVKLAVG